MVTKVTTGVIKEGSLAATHFPAGILTADATGRAKMADAFVTRAKLAAEAPAWGMSKVVGCDCKNNASTPNTYGGE